VPQQALANLKIGQAVTAQVDTYADLTFGESCRRSTHRSIRPPAMSSVRARSQIRTTGCSRHFARIKVDIGTPNSYVTLRRPRSANNFLRQHCLCR